MSSSPNRLQGMLTSKLKYSRKPSLDAATLNQPIHAISSPPSSSPAEIRTIQVINDELRNIAAQTTTFNYRNIVKAVKSFQFQMVRPEGSHLKQIETILTKHGYSMGDPFEIDGVLTIPCKPSSAEARRRSSGGTFTPRAMVAATTPLSTPSNNTASGPTAISQQQPKSINHTQQRSPVSAQIEFPNLDIIVQNVSGKPVPCSQSSPVEQEIREHFQTLNFMKLKAVITELTKNENSIVKNRSAKTPIEDIFLKHRLILRSCTKADNTLHLIAMPSAALTRPLTCKAFVPAPVDGSPAPKVPKRPFLRRSSQAVEPLSTLRSLDNAGMNEPMTTTIISPVSFESIMDGSRKSTEGNTSTPHNEKFDLSNKSIDIVTIPFPIIAAEDNANSTIIPTAAEVEISSIAAAAEEAEIASIIIVEDLQASPIVATADEPEDSSNVPLKITEHASTTVPDALDSPSEADTSTPQSTIGVSPTTPSVIEEAKTLGQRDAAIPATATFIKDPTIRKQNLVGEGLSSASPSGIDFDLLLSDDSGYSSGEESFSSNSANIFDSISDASDLDHAMAAVEKVVESFSTEIASALESAIARIEKKKTEDNALSKKLTHGSAANISFGFNRRVSVGNAMLLIHSSIEFTEGSSTIEASAPVQSSRIPTISSKNNSSITTVIPPSTASNRQPNRHAQISNTSSTTAVTALSTTTISRRTAIPQRASSRGSSASNVATAAVRPSANIRCNTRALKATIKLDKPKFNRNVWN
ncbi:hypothetical protein DFP73DRAFT_524821 [Morchella snyderi]|nr:hypothetical protein DFP73DRAFT_524821 [Morchella snyderi]